MSDDPYRYFRLEAREIVDQCGAAVLDLEKHGGTGEVRRILRLAHTLKGAARVVKQREIADGAHAIEEVLSPFRDGNGTALPRDAVNAVFRQLDVISGHVVALESNGAISAPAVPAQPAAAAAPSQPAVAVAGEKQADRPAPAAEEKLRTVHADLAQMDALLDGVAESHVLLNGLRASLASLEPARHMAELIAAQLAPQHAMEPVAARAAGRDQTYALADDLRHSVGAMERRVAGMVDLLDRELRQLREAAEQLRLAPVGSLFALLERTARDSAQALGKQVAFSARGGDIRIDADILAAAQGALVQIVRNAVAHGIEAPDARRAAGKDEAGRIRLAVARRGDRIVFTCRDDGGGIDLEAIRRAALDHGLTKDTVDRLSSQDLINLMLRGGLSTSAAVTELAGRGIGLDVVRETAERLGGGVKVTTEAGQGTAFELAVPLSLVALDALLVEAAGTTASLPLDAVRGALLLDPGAVARSAGGATVLYENEAVPFLWLARALGGERLPSSGNRSTIVIASEAGSAAIGVERLLGTARIVVRALPEMAPAGPIVAGASLDAEGNPQIVLNVEHLVARARLTDAAEPEPERTRHPVLVIDDSLTTRMLEQSILESAGYEVDVATSAEEGWEIARGKRYALFLVDVEMPGMDGFTFVERTRADPEFRHIPAVLVTSRNAPEDIKRGRDAGASGYIVKGEFNQAELLQLIRPLIG